ncbi:MAG: hypothetical protein ACLP07_10050 [Terracidiphilus sp.]
MFRIVIRSFLGALICVPACAEAQTTPVESETTLRTRTDLVVIDVTVIDSQRKPATHLEAPDFSILEDGHLQTIKVFEEHMASALAPVPPAPKARPWNVYQCLFRPCRPSHTGAFSLLTKND